MSPHKKPKSQIHPNQSYPHILAARRGELANFTFTPEKFRVAPSTFCHVNKQMPAPSSLSNLILG
jgi:hypothetical protein